jgi:hypothetical protein
MPQPAGYSGKRLIEKIGLKPNQILAVVRPPVHYGRLVEPLPLGAEVRPVLVGGDLGDASVIHLFVRSREALERDGREIAASAPEGSAIWVSWPKKSSSLFCGVTEDTIREVLLPTGWVDVKVAAVDDDWSGLKLLRRRTG